MKKKKPVAATVASLEKEGDFYLLTIKPPTRFKFQPGQFVKMYSDSELKNFAVLSFFSAPKEKKVQFMFDASTPIKRGLAVMEKGSKIYIEGPYGEFSVSRTPTHSVLFCKGMGLVPISSIAKSLIDKKKKLNIYILYENMDRKDIVGEERLKEFERHKQANILMTLLNERPMDWPGKIGPLSADMIEGFVPGLNSKDYYLCGPAAFANRIKDTLLEMKVPEKRIKIEPWE